MSNVKTKGHQNVLKVDCVTFYHKPQKLIIYVPIQILGHSIPVTLFQVSKGKNEIDTKTQTREKYHVFKSVDLKIRNVTDINQFCKFVNV